MPSVKNHMDDSEIFTIEFNQTQDDLEAIKVKVNALTKTHDATGIRAAVFGS